MNFLTTYKDNIIIAVVVLLLTIIALSGGYIKIQSNEIKSLQKTLVDKEVEISNEKANNTTLRSSIKDQNQKIEEHKNNYDSKLREFQEWKDKPAEIKYKEIIKYQEIKSNECKDIKNIINDIRNTSF